MEFTNNSISATISNGTNVSAITTDPPAHQVWGYGLLLVTGVNLCSLFGIAVNPLSKQHWYRNLLLFMVSVAVGVLAGSSLLFLFYGALEFDRMEWEFRKNYIIKVTIALSTVFIFFNFEQLLKLVLAKLMARRKSKAQGDNQCTCQRLDSTCDSNKNAKNNNDEASKSLVAYPPVLVTSSNYCRSCSCSENNPDLLASSQRKDKDISLNDLPVSTFSHHHPSTRVSTVAGISLGLSGAMTSGNAGDNDVFDQEGPPPKSPRSIVKVAADPLTNLPTIKGYNGGIQVEIERSDSESITSIAVKTLSQVQPVAWMVIFGDGIHNFVDGLSIGAGMARSFPEGLSIVLAVLAEELPHELGDLAVLLRSGLPLRRALLFNFLSACLCYVGFAIGAIVGELPAANTVIYSIAAGLFLYIALTDLLPEVAPDSKPEGADGHDHHTNTESLLNETPASQALSSSVIPASKPLSVRHLCTHLAIADTGMLFGYAIIVILAVYTDSIASVMESNPNLFSITSSTPPAFSGNLTT